MFKINPIPKEIIRNQETKTIKNYLGEDIILTTGTKHSTDEEKLQIFNSNLIKLEELIKNVNQVKNIQNWIDNFYEKLNKISFWYVYTSNRNDIIFHINYSYGVLHQDNSIQIITECNIVIFSLDGMYKEHKIENNFYQDEYDMRDWWFNEINEGNTIQIIEDDETFGDDDDKESIGEIQKRMEVDISKGIMKKSYGSIETENYIKKEFLIYNS